MAVIDEKGLTGILKRLLDISLIVGTLVIITLPFFLKFYLDIYYKFLNNRENYYFLLCFLPVTGALCLVIVNEIRKIFLTLNRRNPFMMDNVRSFKIISFASFVVSALFVLKVFFFLSFLTIGVAIVFLIAAIFSIILSEVFHQAVIVKEENDLTI